MAGEPIVAFVDSRDENVIAEFFRHEPGVTAVWLFGSQAHGTARPDSDVDLGVLYADGRRPDDPIRWYRTLFGRLSALGAGEPDLVLLNDADPVLRRQVIERGRPLLVIDEDHAREFRVRSWMEYLDLAPIRERIQAARRVAVGDR